MAEREQRGGRDQRGGGRERKEREERDSEFVAKPVHLDRVAQVVKGGKRFGCAALVVMGDQKGRAGFGHGKAREVPEALRKATESAKRNLTLRWLRRGGPLHDASARRSRAGGRALEAPAAARQDGARVCLLAAPTGPGSIAGGAMRAMLEALA